MMETTFQDQFLPQLTKYSSLPNLQATCWQLDLEQKKISFGSQEGLEFLDVFYHNSQQNISNNLQFLNSNSNDQQQNLKRKRKTSLSSELLRKNQTKNIPKNYGKAIIGYITRNKSQTLRLLHQQNLNVEAFYNFLECRSRGINTISDLRELWEMNPYARVLRILSNQFMRKHSLGYIFKSRIKNYLTHIKYREKLMQGIRNPSTFTNIKDY